MKICCITGHRPHKFPFDYTDRDGEAYRKYADGLYLAVKELALDGYGLFLSGMADGADSDFFETVKLIRSRLGKAGEAIAFEAVFPYPNKKSGIFEREYPGVKTTVLSPCFDRSCYQRRNEYMVDKSDLVLAVWNGERAGGTWNTIEYAEKTGKPVRYIML